MTVMKIHTLKYSCKFDASLNDVYRFHTDTQNLPRITPPWINVTIESIDEPFVEHSRISLIIKRFGIGTRWVMEIETLQCPHMITDLMISGPFSLFRHQRIFTAISDYQTKMEEKITIKLPMGWVGNLLFPFIKADMDKMFAYRHRATQEFLQYLTPIEE